MLFYPSAHLEQTLRLTSAKLRAKNHMPLSRQEFFVFIALLVGVALYPKQTLRQLFNPTRPGHKLCSTPNFSKYMRYKRYTAISVNLTFNETEDPSYCFWKVRPLVTAFNDLRKRLVLPGRVLCVDESFSWWDGSEGAVTSEGLPHVSKLKDKPRGIGLMIKNVCDSESGVMLAIELVASTEEMQTREFVSEFGAGTGYLLRLTKKQWGSGRIVVADSAFASVLSAVQLKHKGLYFIGHVKTAHRKCPKKFMRQRQYEMRGDHCVATTVVDGVPLRCVGWNEGKRKKGVITPKVYVGSCGTTIPGTPHLKTCWKNIERKSLQYQVPIPRPQMITTYHESCGKIDDHNQLGHGILGLEYRRTTRWQFRFFQTFVRFCMVDAFLAYRAFARPTEEPALLPFVHTVLDDLLDNIEGEQPNAAPLRPPDNAPVADGGQGETRARLHVEKRLADSVYFQQKARAAINTGSPVQRARLTCRVCKKLTSTYCTTCTGLEDGRSPRRLVALCSARGASDCYVRHHESPHTPPLARSRRCLDDDNFECLSSDDEFE